MATIQKFEDLEIWQKARLISKKIYPSTFIKPISEDFRYKDQIRGSVGSIMDNIAEGFERGSKFEFINSLTIAKDEVGEFKSQLTGVWIINISLKKYFQTYLLLQMN